MCEGELKADTQRKQTLLSYVDIFGNSTYGIHDNLSRIQYKGTSQVRVLTLAARFAGSFGSSVRSVNGRCVSFPAENAMAGS